MGRRRLGRETAFKALYGADLTGKGIDESFDDMMEETDSRIAIAMMVGAFFVYITRGILWVFMMVLFV